MQTAALQISCRIARPDKGIGFNRSASAVAFVRLLRSESKVSLLKLVPSEYACNSDDTAFSVVGFQCRSRIMGHSRLYSPLFIQSSPHY